jgi:DNA-directed RNA polymerase I and III subunit RPAC2
MAQESRQFVFEYENEDHTLGNLLQSYLLNNVDAAYVAYTVPHPLEKKCNLVLSVKDTCEKNPNRVLKEQIDVIISDVKKLRENFKTALRSEVSSEASSNQ